MPSRPRTATILAFCFILGGLMLFAYSQYTNVFPDPQRTEFGEPQPTGTAIGDTTFVLGSGLLVTIGALTLVGRSSPAHGWGKAVAMTVFAAALFVFLVSNFSLFINGIAITGTNERIVAFTASYLFHSGNLLSFAGVYVLFLYTLTLVLLLLGSLGYLLAPRRIARALWDPQNWEKNEAVHVASSLLLLLSLTVFFVYLLRLTVEADVGAMRAKGPLAQNLVALYYLLILLLFFLILSIAAHVFLVNWGTETPLEHGQLLEGVRNVARVERILLGFTVLLDVILLFSPTLVSGVSLSNDPVFVVSPRGFAWLYFLILLPYVPYAVSQRRLERLLIAGHARVGRTPFSAQSLKLVQRFLVGIVLITVLAVAARWEPLSTMLSFSAWTAGILVSHSLALRIRGGLPQPVLRSGGSLPLYFAFVALALTTGLMLWGAGNTFEVLYLESTRSLQFVNEASFGEDIASRIGAATLLAGTLVLTLHLFCRSVGVRQRFLAHYIWLFLITTVAATTTFTVGVWTKGPRGLQDAYAGFAFRQYYGTEQLLVGFLLTMAVVATFLSLGQILGAIVDRTRPQRAVS